MNRNVTSQLTVTLLGPPRVERAGGPVALPRRRTRSLLYFLAAAPGGHGRDELVDLLWPHLEAARGRRQLSDALSDLRRALGAAAVDSDSERVALAGHECDAYKFTAAVGRAGRLSGAEAATELARALDLYGGEFLAGVRVEGSERFEEWVEEQRLVHSVAALGAYARLATLHLDAADPASAIQVAQRGLEIDSLREDLWRIAIRARADLGDRQGALAEYARCRDTLRRELGAAPEAETEALRRRISAERGTPGAGTSEAAAARARPPVPPAVRLPGSSLALVGRERELATLLRAWLTASDGTGGLAAIRGEPGIGKSRLAAEFGARVAGAGATVLAARCPDLRDPPPHGPIEEAIRGVLPALQPGALKELGPEWLPWIGRLLPELSLGIGPPERMAPEEEKTRLAEGAGQLLDAISGGRPLLLVVEDIHWAHPATVQLLHALTRRRRPLLVLVTLRDTEPGSEGGQATRRALADLAREELATTISLGPLGSADTETLVRLVVDSDGGGRRVSAAALAKLAEGQPLFALELARAVLESPDDPSLPESLATAIGARIERASALAGRVLELATVFGRPVTLRLLGRATGIEPPDEGLVDVAEELMTRRLLQEDETGALAPSHGLIGAAVYRSLSTSRRRALHARVASALEAGPEVPAGTRSEVLARHYRLAGDLSRAAEHLLEAGARAEALGEIDTAAARFRRAAEILRREGRELEAAAALERSGKCVWRSCEIDVAAAAFTEALEAWEGLPDNTEPLARLHAAMAQLVTRWGYLISDLFDVQFHVEAAVRLTAGTAGEERSLALSARAFARAFAGDLEAADEDAREALNLAAGSDAAWHSAMDAAAITALLRKDWQRGLEATEERVRRATRQRDPFELYDASMTATMACTALGDLAAAEDHARASEQAGNDTGQALKAYHGRTLIAEVLVAGRRWAEAEELVPALLEHPDHLNDRPSFVSVRKCLAAELAAGRGDLAFAREQLRGVPAMPHFEIAWCGGVRAAYERAGAAIREAEARSRSRAGAASGR